jgi:peptide/nickel transport system substrate-binding protein
MKKVVNFISIVTLLALLLTLGSTALLAQEEVVCENDVIVQADDWLSKIADKFYGNVLAYPAIAEATNAKAATDDSYTTIENVDLIEPGWKLCIPSTAYAETVLGETLAQPVAAAAGSILRVTFSWPTFIDPAVGSDFSSSTSLANIYDTLIFPNAEAGVDPWLAESWDVSSDGLTYTFHLRKGVKFHDGSELLASDVVYSYERLQAIGEGYAYLITGVESVTAVDDYTVEFKLERPSGLFVPSLVRLYIANEDLVRTNTLPEGPYGDEGDYGKEWLLTHDAGSGPYEVVEFPLEEYLLMKKFGDWWNAASFRPNAPDQVKFIATTETATVRALMDDGELEITDQWQTVEALQALDAMEGIDIKAFSTMTSFYYMMNTRKPPLDDVHCRRAVSWAFDYDQAVALEWPGTQQMVGPVPHTVGGWDPNVLTYHRDLDKAKEELAQCQYGADIANYPVEVVWIADVPAEEKWALLFQANMADIGVPVEVVSQPWLSVVENTSAQDTSPHIVTIYVSTDLPEAGLMLQQRYHSSTANTWQQNEWLLDKAFDAAITDALATVNQADRFAKYRDLQKQIAELAPSLYLYDQLEKHAVANYVEWTPEANSAVMGYQIYAPRIGVTR